MWFLTVGVGDPCETLHDNSASSPFKIDTYSNFFPWIMGGTGKIN